MSPRKRGVGLFLSTPSGWRATAAAVAEPAAALDISIHALRVEGDTMLGSACRLKMHFYPRPPGGGRLLLFIFLAFLLCISIHALRVEGDSPSPPSFVTVPISIHALRVEGDWSRAFPRIMQQHFYPRPPGGGRHKCQVYYNQKKGFLSTPSGWRATEEYRVMQERGFISIHALRVEGDR